MLDGLSSNIWSLDIVRTVVLINIMAVRIASSAYDSIDISRLMMLTLEHVATIVEDTLQWRDILFEVIDIDRCLHNILSTLVVCQSLLPLTIAIEALNLHGVFTCWHILDGLIHTSCCLHVVAFNETALESKVAAWSRPA